MLPSCGKDTEILPMPAERFPRQRPSPGPSHGTPRTREEHTPSSSTASTVAPLLSRAWTTEASPFRAAMWSGLGRGKGGTDAAAEPPTFNTPC